MKAMIPFGTPGFLTSDVDRLVGDLFGRGWGNGLAPQGPAIRLDLTETDEAYRIVAEIPGVPREELDISVTSELLSLSGEKKRESDTEGHLERVFGRFERKVRFPVPVDPNSVTAESKDGVLTIHLPKADVARPRRVEISG